MKSYPLILIDLTLNLISELIGVFILGVIFNYFISLKYKHEILPVKTNLNKQVLNNINSIVVLVNLINKNMSQDDSGKYINILSNFKTDIQNYVLYANLLEVEVINELQQLYELLNNMNSTIIIRIGISERQFNEDKINVLKKVNDIFLIMTGNYDESASKLITLLEERI